MNSELRITALADLSIASHYTSPGLLNLDIVKKELDYISYPKNTSTSELFLKISLYRQLCEQFIDQETELAQLFNTLFSLRSQFWKCSSHEIVITGACEDGQKVKHIVPTNQADFNNEALLEFERTCTKVIHFINQDYANTVFGRQRHQYNIEQYLFSRCFGSNLSLLKEFVTILFVALKSDENLSSNDMFFKSRIERWLSSAVNLLYDSFGIESNCLFVLSHCLDCCQLGNTSFSFNWVTSLFRIPDLSVRTDEDVIRISDLCLTATKLVCDSAYRLVASNVYKHSHGHFQIVGEINNEAVSSYLIKILERIPFDVMSARLEAMSTCLQSFKTVVSFCWQLVSMLSGTYRHTSASLKDFDCFTGKICVSISNMCLLVSSKLGSDPEVELYIDSFIIRVVRQFFLSKTSKSEIADSGDAETPPIEVVHSRGLIYYLTKMNFSLLSSHELLSHLLYWFCSVEYPSDFSVMLETEHNLRTTRELSVRNFMTNFYRFSGIIHCSDISDDGFNLLRVLVNVTQSENGVSRCPQLVNLVFCLVWNVCFVDIKTRVVYAKKGCELYGIITRNDCELIDRLLQLVADSIVDSFVVEIVPHLFGQLAFENWCVTNDNLSAITKLISLPVDNVAQKSTLELLDLVLESISDQTSIKTKLDLVKFIVIHYSSIVSAKDESKLADFFNYSDVKLSEKQQFANWCWRFVFKLSMDVPAHYPLNPILEQVLCQNFAFCKFTFLLVYRKFDSISELSDHAFEFIISLIHKEFYVNAIYLCHVLLPSVHTEFSHANELGEVFQLLCNADRQVLSVFSTRRHDYFSLFSSMLVHLCGSDVTSPAASVVLRVILGNSSIRNSSNFTSILNEICTVCFYKESLRNGLLSKFVEQSQSYILVKKDPDSLLNKVTMTYAPLMEKLDSKTPYLNYFSILGHFTFEQESGFWALIVKILQTDKQCTLTSAVFRARYPVKIRSNCLISSDNLAISLLPKLIQQTSAQHATYLLLWRLFIRLGFQYDSETSMCLPIGHRCFTSFFGFSVLQKLAGVASDAVARLSNGTLVLTNGVSEKRACKFLNICSVLLSDCAVQNGAVNLYDIPPKFYAEQFADLVFLDKVSMFEYFPLSAVDAYGDAYFESLERQILCSVTPCISSATESEKFEEITDSENPISEVCGPISGVTEHYIPITSHNHDGTQFVDFDSIDLMSHNAISAVIDPHLSVIVDYARSCVNSTYKLENRFNTIIRGAPLEYARRRRSEVIEIPCSRIFHKECTSPAIIKWERDDYLAVEENIGKIDNCLTDANVLVTSLFLSGVEDAVKSYEYLVSILSKIVDCGSVDGETVSFIFFRIIDFCLDQVHFTFSPFMHAIEGLLRITASNCEDAKFASHFLQVMETKPWLVSTMVPFFKVTQSEFVRLYASVLSSIENGSLESNVATNLLSKFDVVLWLGERVVMDEIVCLITALLRVFSCEAVTPDYSLANWQTLALVHYSSLFEFDCFGALYITSLLVLDVAPVRFIQKQFYDVILSGCQFLTGDGTFSEILKEDSKIECIVELISARLTCANFESALIWDVNFLKFLECVLKYYVYHTSNICDLSMGPADIEGFVRKIWQKVTEIYDNFCFSEFGGSKRVHIVSYLSLIQCLYCTFNTVCPSFDASYIGQPFVNAFDLTLNRYFKMIAKNTTHRYQDYQFHMEQLHSFPWHIYIPSRKTLRNLHDLFEHSEVQTLAVRIFVATNWQAFTDQQILALDQKQDLEFSSDSSEEQSNWDQNSNCVGLNCRASGASGIRGSFNATSTPKKKYPDEDSSDLSNNAEMPDLDKSGDTSDLYERNGYSELRKPSILDLSGCSAQSNLQENTINSDRDENGVVSDRTENCVDLNRKAKETATPISNIAGALKDLLMLAICAKFERPLPKSSFLQAIGFDNETQQEFTLVSVSIDSTLSKLSEINWSPLQCPEFKQLVTKYENSFLKSKQVLDLRGSKVVNLFMNSACNSFKETESVSVEEATEKLTFFVSTLCRLIITQNAGLRTNVRQVLWMLHSSCPIKACVIEVESCIFELFESYTNSKLVFHPLYLAVQDFGRSNDTEPDQLLWVLESVIRSMENSSYLCRLAEKVIEISFSRKDNIYWSAICGVFNESPLNVNPVVLLEDACKYGCWHVLFAIISCNKVNANAVIEQLESLEVDSRIKYEEYNLIILYYVASRLVFEQPSSDMKRLNVDVLIGILSRVMSSEIMGLLMNTLGVPSNFFSEQFKFVSKCILLFCLRMKENMSSENMSSNKSSRSKKLCVSLNKYARSMRKRSKGLKRESSTVSLQETISTFDHNLHESSTISSQEFLVVNSREDSVAKIPESSANVEQNSSIAISHESSAGVEEEGSTAKFPRSSTAKLPVSVADGSQESSADNSPECFVAKLQEGSATIVQEVLEDILQKVLLDVEESPVASSLECSAASLPEGLETSLQGSSALITGDFNRYQALVDSCTNDDCYKCVFKSVVQYFYPTKRALVTMCSNDELNSNL